MEYRKKKFPLAVILMVLLVFSLLIGGCSMGPAEDGSTGDNLYKGGSLGGETIRILSGSENKELSDREVSVKEILSDIEQGKLTFCMTSATQSNSGASAYIGFLYALLGKSEGLTEEDLDDPKLREDISGLLSGIDRSSGSSDWLKDMFLSGNFCDEGTGGGTDMYLALERGLEMIAQSYDC